MSHTDARAQYPNVYALVAGYFHQDWDLDDATWQGVVSRYVSDATPGELRALRTELASLVEAVSNEDTLRLIVLEEFGGEYDPSPELSMHDWLGLVLREVRSVGGERSSDSDRG